MLRMFAQKCLIHTHFSTSKIIYTTILGTNLKLHTVFTKKITAFLSVYIFKYYRYVQSFGNHLCEYYILFYFILRNDSNSILILCSLLWKGQLGDQYTKQTKRHSCPLQLSSTIISLMLHCNTWRFYSLLLATREFVLNVKANSYLITIIYF